MELEQGQGPGRTPVCPGGPRPLSATPARPMFSSSRGKDEIQGLPFGRCDVGMPQIHHENHPWAVLRRTWGRAVREERFKPPGARTWAEPDPRGQLSGRDPS